MFLAIITEVGFAAYFPLMQEWKDFISWEREEIARGWRSGNAACQLELQNVFGFLC